MTEVKESGSLISDKRLSSEQVEFERKAAELAANASLETKTMYQTMIDPKGSPRAINLSSDLAALIWRDNKRNRDFAFSKAKIFAGLIERGEFVYTHQGIAFYADGQLFDGQHRIAACIMADRTIRVQSTPNMDQHALLAIDMSKPRTAGDALQLEGIADGNAKGTTAKAVIQYERRLANAVADVSAMQIAEFVRTNDVILQQALDAAVSSRDKVSDAPIDKRDAAVAITLMLRGGYALHLAAAFLTSAQHGIANSESDPVLVLNKRMTRAKLSEKKKDNMRPIEKQAAILRAASAWAQGLKINKVDWKSGKEPLPSPNFPQTSIPQAAE